jgi:endoglucanase
LRALRADALPVRLFASFTVAEEVGTRGIKAIGAVEPWAAALHLETTVAGDVPGVAPHLSPTRMGAGPAISVADRSVIVAQRMVDFLESVAREEAIPTQRKKPTFGGTNAGALHQTGRGVLCGVISTPARYIHSPVTLMLRDDLDAAIRLTLAATRRIDALIRD